MTDASPALPDDELRETLELFSTVMASVSDRVDAQTGVLDRVNKTAAEARQAAFAARSQTDPQKYGDLVGETIDGRINDNLVRMARFALELGQQTNVTARTLEKAEEDKLAILREVREREQKADRLKRRLPWFGLGGCPGGPGPDDCPSAFLCQQRCHMRCAWGPSGPGQQAGSMPVCFMWSEPMIRKIVGWYNKRALSGSQRSCVKYVLIYGLRVASGPFLYLGTKHYESCGCVITRSKVCDNTFKGV